MPHFKDMGEIRFDWRGGADCANRGYSTELGVQPGAPQPDRAAIGVIARPADELPVEAQPHDPVEPPRIQRLDDLFGAVTQGAVAKKKAESARRQIVAMRL
jgi:hypothetical protein